MKLFKYIILVVVLPITFLSCKRGGISGLFQDTSIPESKPLLTAEQYAAECSAAGVVLPHVSSDRLFWNERRTIDPRYVHFAAGMGDEGVILVHSDPAKGGCLQLNTSSLDRTQNKLYTIAFAICWSREGSACFWEQHDKSKEEVETSLVISNSDSATPYAQVTNNCLACHRGDNPFVGHGEFGDPVFNNFPEVSFTRPIVPPQWISGSWAVMNQRGDESYQCSGACHSIPKLEANDGFCSIGVGMMHDGLMLGAKFKLKSFRAQQPRDQAEYNGNRPDPMIADEPAKPEPLNQETLVQCRQYANFLRACGNPKLTKNDLGICPLE